MKKYLAAAVVAVMVFAFSAFAASLSLGDSVLAGGEADVGNCGGDLDVISWGAELDTMTVSNVVFDKDGLGDCGEDEVILVQVHNDDGDEVGRSGELQVSDIPISGQRATVGLHVHQTTDPVPLEPIESIRAVIHTKTG